MDKTELLAPAGNYEAFLAAVQNGADAVYLGGTCFNARQFAGNFDMETLEKAVDYAHLRCVKVYLTLNTLISDDEMEQAVNYAVDAWNLGIDALIVQDLGLAHTLAKYYPEIELHASTQMTIYDLNGVRQMEEMGFKRVVLARELSLEEIKAIALSSRAEIEVFVHGALCISYSGQCLMSSMIGGRSGNRGKCAQPCRMKYELLKDGQSVKKGFLLSPKDYQTVNALDRLVNSGVKSLKIEGRMKSPEYVAVVTGIYRKYLDMAFKGAYEVDPSDYKKLVQIFNRGGFTRSYLDNSKGVEMMSWEKPKNWGLYLGRVASYNEKYGRIKASLQESLGNGDGVEIWNGRDESPGNIVTNIILNGKQVEKARPGQTIEFGYIKGNINQGDKIYKTSDKLLNLEAKKSYKDVNNIHRLIFGRFEMHEGMESRLEVWDESGNAAEAVGIMPEKAVNRPLSHERINQQLIKTGEFPFEFKEIEIKTDSGLVIPISELNKLRREAVLSLQVKIINLYKRSLKAYSYCCNKKADRNSDNTELAVMLHKFDTAWDLSKLGVQSIYIPALAYIKQRNSIKSQLQNSGKRIFIHIPFFHKSLSEDIIFLIKKEILKDNLIEGVILTNPGQLQLFKGFDKTIRFDSAINCFNSCTAGLLRDWDIKGVTLSQELTLDQITSINASIQREAVIYGRTAVMRMEFCPVGAYSHRSNAQKCTGMCNKGEFSLKDRKGEKYPVMSDVIGCTSTIFSNAPVFVPEEIKELINAGIEILRMDILDESFESTVKLSEIVSKIIKEKTADTLNKEQKDFINNIKNKGFTKGHYYRGV